MDLQQVTSLLSVGSTDMQMVSRATGERWTQSDAARVLGPYKDRRGQQVVLGQRETFAFRFRFLRDSSVRGELKGYLFEEAVNIKERESWPSHINRLDLRTSEWVAERYIADLVELAMLEEHHLFKIANMSLWYLYMRVEPVFWYRNLSRKYEAIRYYLEMWCGTACSHVRRNIGPV